MKLHREPDPKAEVAMTPLIDCVFLLLVFFMVSTTFNKQEADISFALPGTAEQSDAVEIPDEQIIQITENGNVFLNDLEYDSPSDPAMPELIKTLILFRQTAEANKVPAMITIAPEDLSLIHISLVVFYPYSHNNEPRGLTAAMNCYAELKEWDPLSRTIQEIQPASPNTPAAKAADEILEKFKTELTEAGQFVDAAKITSE